MATDYPSEATTWNGNDGQETLEIPVVWSVVLLALCCGAVCGVGAFCVRLFCWSPPRVVPKEKTCEGTTRAPHEAKRQHDQQVAKEMHDRAQADAHERNDAAARAARIQYETECRDIVRGALAAQGQRYRQERAVIRDPARDVAVEAGINLQLYRAFDVQS